MNPDRWDDLSDSELRARLTQRGVPTDEANELVDEREQSVAARTRITFILEHQ